MFDREVDVCSHEEFSFVCLDVDSHKRSSEAHGASFFHRACGVERFDDLGFVGTLESCAGEDPRPHGAASHVTPPR